MDATRKTLVVNPSSKRHLHHKLRQKGAIIRFEEDPLVASLCACMALDFEIGNPEFDRLSTYLGVEDLSLCEKRLFIDESCSEIGMELSRRDGQPLSPRHEDLRYLLDASSLEDGMLTRAVIYPARVARTYATMGFHLVIVRDWILNSALAVEGPVVGYLLTNEWEIKNHIATTQAQMMCRHELPFFGTHDIVDHLFGLNAPGYDLLECVQWRAKSVFDGIFDAQGLGAFAQQVNSPALWITYLIGVALDDIAQPRWYGSQAHRLVIDACLEELPSITNTNQSARGLELPPSFHVAAATMRELPANSLAIGAALKNFFKDCRI